jgi:hypothetical protein
MADTSLSQPYGVSARYAAVITPADDTDLANVTRAVYVGTGGDLEVVMVSGGNTVVIPGVPDGAFLPISVSRIRDENTTATGIVAFW